MAVRVSGHVKQMNGRPCKLGPSESITDRNCTHTRTVQVTTYKPVSQPEYYIRPEYTEYTIMYKLRMIY